MSSSKQIGERTPFQDVINTHSSDPLELKRQRERERYALRREDILRRKKEAREQQVDAAVVDNGNSKANASDSAALIASHDPKGLKRQKAREYYALHRDDILKKQKVARDLKKTLAATATPALPNYRPSNASQIENAHGMRTQETCTWTSALTQLQVTGRTSSGKENLDVHNVDGSDWLHRNDGYRMRRTHQTHTHTIGPIRTQGSLTPHSGFFTVQESGILTATPICNMQHADMDPCVGSNNVELNGSVDILQRRREQYFSMPEVQRSIVLSKKRDNYERRKVIRDCMGGINEDPNNIVCNDQTNDAYGIFEPDVHQPVGTYINCSSLFNFCTNNLGCLGLTNIFATRLLGHNVTK